MHPARIVFLFIFSLSLAMSRAWTREVPLDRIFGANRDEVIAFIKQFPIENYEIFYSAPSSAKFYLDKHINDHIKGSLRLGFVWEPHIKELILRYVKPQSIVLDIGAHIGTHTLDMSKAVGPLGRVMAFEPQPKLFRELVFNMTLNRIRNVDFYPVAISDHEGSIELPPLKPFNEGGSSFIWKGTNQFVPLITVDSLQLDNVSLMKIDVELFENFVLEGARNTIARCRPVILIEIRGDYALEGAPQEIKDQILFTISKLEHMGYVVRCITFADYLALPL